MSKEDLEQKSWGRITGQRCLVFWFFGFFKLFYEELKEENVQGIAARAPYQTPILPDQILLDILRVESVMFDIKFTCLKIFDFTQDF